MKEETDRQYLIKTYSQKMRDLGSKLKKQPPKFDINDLESYIRWTERRLRYLHQMNEIRIILHFLSAKI